MVYNTHMNIAYKSNNNIVYSLSLIHIWFIISTFFIFLSINNFHNPLYDTAIYSTPLLCKFKVFSVFFNDNSAIYTIIESFLLYHTIDISSMIITNQTFDFTNDLFENPKTYHGIFSFILPNTFSAHCSNSMSHYQHH